MSTTLTPTFVTNIKSEKDVKSVVRHVLECEGVWLFMPSANGYGVPGIPDFIGCYRGHMFSVETKFGTNKQTMWQVRQGHAIIKAGAPYWLIDEDNAHNFSAVFAGWKALCS